MKRFEISKGGTVASEGVWIHAGSVPGFPFVVYLLKRQLDLFRLYVLQLLTVGQGVLTPAEAAFGDLDRDPLLLVRRVLWIERRQFTVPCDNLGNPVPIF